MGERDLTSYLSSLRRRARRLPDGPCSPASCPRGYRLVQFAEGSALPESLLLRTVTLSRVSLQAHSQSSSVPPPLHSPHLQGDLARDLRLCQVQTQESARVGPLLTCKKWPFNAAHPGATAGSQGRASIPQHGLMRRRCFLHFLCSFPEFSKPGGVPEPRFRECCSLDNSQPGAEIHH